MNVFKTKTFIFFRDMLLYLLVVFFANIFARYFFSGGVPFSPSAVSPQFSLLIFPLLLLIFSYFLRFFSPINPFFHLIFLVLAVILNNVIDFIDWGISTGQLYTPDNETVGVIYLFTILNVIIISVGHVFIKYFIIAKIRNDL